MTQGHVDADLVAFSHGEVLGERAEEVEQHLAQCERCADLRVRLAATEDLLREAVVVPPEALRESVLSNALADDIVGSIRSAVPSLPPPELRDRVLAAASPQGSPVRRSVRGGWRAREVILGVAAIAALLFAMISWPRSTDEGDQSDIPRGHDMQVVALRGTSDGEATLTHYKHDNFRLTLSAEGYRPTPAGFFYAVWLRGEAGDIALGGFRLKGPDDFQIPFAIAVNPADYPTVTVTLEPIDGTPELEGRIVSRAELDPESIQHGRYDP